MGSKVTPVCGEVTRRWYRLLSSPRGLLVIVGPTGSGKTTTLYTSIQRLNQEGVNIVTIEDPVEYTLPGLTQVQVNERAGITFANSIRALLRQDPNVIIVGEMRDGETAQAALNAANTGHLVLSTLHADHVVGAVTRLLNLDVPRYLLGSALSGVLSQRLVRRLCPECSLPVSLSAEEWGYFGLPVVPGGQPRRAGPGCPACQYLGYSGRIGLFELLPFSAEMATLVQGGGTEEDLWNLAHQEGLRTLLEDALTKLLMGLTSMEELARVVDVSDYPRKIILACVRTVVEAQAAADVPARTEEPAPVDAPIAAAPPEIPPSPLDVPTPLAVRAPPLEVTVSSLESPVEPRRRARILVVDDAEEIVSLVSLTLEDDFEISSARDGVEALEAVAGNRPDLMVLDVMMPRLSGYEVCERLKEKAETRDIPIIMLSARGERAHIKRGLRLGADDYLPKPFDPEELLLRCRALLRRSGWTGI